MTFTALIVVTGSLSASAPAGDGAYARPQLLREPADLLAAIGAGSVAVVDARPRADYEKGRIPAACWVDAAAWAKGFGEGDDARAWSRRIGALGIALGSRAVVYDDGRFKDAARIWWILRYWGVERAALLQGNWKGWKAAGFPIESAPPRHPAAVVFPARAAPKRLALKGDVLAGIDDGGTQIVDARSEAEFCGTDRGKNRRGGSIPGSTNLDWIDLIEKEADRFKPAGELRHLFEAAGIDPGKPSIAYCQSGARASVMASALELLGAGDVRNYYASWEEWGNADDAPVVPGKPREKE